MERNRILCAHTKEGGNGIEEQTLREHSRHVAEMCAKACRGIGIENLGYLTGLLHDSGKASEKIQEHLKGRTKEKINHSAAGMRWLWERYAGKGGYYQLAAEMAAHAIGCHHSGRCDLISPQGSMTWKERMQTDAAKQLYEESIRNFFGDCCTVDEADRLMDRAAVEVQRKLEKLRKAYQKEFEHLDESRNNDVQTESIQFSTGFLQRFLFSALVDADWLDSACYMEGKPLPVLADERQRLERWRLLEERTEKFMQSLTSCYPVDVLRSEISEQCREEGKRCAPGIYRLYVPTGGGKTYAGLRFCMQMAVRQNAEHIFYFSPYKSITTQNAQSIRNILGSDFVLEHHSDVIFEHGDAQETERWLASTQRWQGEPIICTTMVQLLNTLFAAPRQNVRRLAALSGSVLLFDEVQALPLRQTFLLNLAVNTLVYGMGCTVVVCTATQPPLEELRYPLLFGRRMDLVPDYERRFEQFRRTEILPHPIQGEENVCAMADFVQKLSEEHSSVLVILNTKDAVNRLAEQIEPLLPKETQLFCLTTLLCPQHRADKLKQMCRLLDSHGEERVVCISTQLIEAGVDISFSCVVRSMAGLPSVIQAAGRCNRHGSKQTSPVYLVDYKEKGLRYLPEIDNAAQATRQLLRQLPPQTDLLSPQAIDRYYKIYYANGKQDEEMSYPLKQKGLPVRTTMLDLLCANRMGTDAYCAAGHSLKSAGFLKQAFGTAEENFEAIPDETIPVVVPYGEGAEKIKELLSGRFQPSKLHTLQPYTVALSRARIKALADAVVCVQEGNLRVLQESFYDCSKGVCSSQQELPVMMV